MTNKITIYPLDPRDMDALGVRRFTEPQPYQLNVLSGHYGARAAGVEYTQSARKFFETEQAIAEALEMRRRGRPAPLPKPTLISLHIFHIIETWSQYK